MKKNKNLQSRFHLSKWSFVSSHMSDILRVKPKAAVNLLLKVKLIAGGKVSKVFTSSIFVFLQHLRVIVNSQGNSGIIIYLKSSQIALQQAASGYKIKDMRTFGTRVSRTKGSLLPRIIPASHRRIINNNLFGKYFLLKFYLTVFYCYRVIIVPTYKLKLSTITDPGNNFVLFDTIPEAYFRRFLSAFIRQDNLYWFPEQAMQKIGRFFTILKSSPNNIPESGGGPLWSTHPLVMYTSAMALKADKQIWESYTFLMKVYSPMLIGLFRKFERFFPGKLGKLAFKEEAAGKLRVFAIVDNFTQWLLDPLHRIIFSILKRIPMDGTFNQVRPIQRLISKNCKSYYSLDLTAATDRLPLIIQINLLNKWFQRYPKFGDHWGQLLVGRNYSWVQPEGVKSSIGSYGKVKYAVGQPMGALSSWAMLALTHHFLVQVAAWRIGFTMKGNLYRSYALLGDDLVIVDRSVAYSYLEIMNKIGVGINLAKSILSPSGKGLEFAKRTFIDGMDVSPISFKDLSEALRPGNISEWVAFANKHKLNFFKQSVILGYGFRTCKNSFHRMCHGLQILFLTNIAKVDFDSSKLALRFKVPIEINGHLPLFLEKVLKPEIDRIREGFTKPNENKPYPQSTYVEVRTWYERVNSLINIKNWARSEGGSVAMNNLFERFHGEIPEITSIGDLLSKVDTTSTYIQNMLIDMCNLHNAVIDDETPRIFKKLDSILKVVDLSKVTTMDEALTIYLLIIKLRAVQDINVLRLKRVEAQPSKKFPYQVRLFRTWSKTVHNVVKYYRSK